MKPSKYYRKRPVIISAYQSDCDGYIQSNVCIAQYRKGDYVVTGITGERYTIQKAIFERSYVEASVEDMEVNHD